MRFLFTLISYVCAALLISTPAQAKWHVAESDNFVIYANDNEKDIAKFSEYLERYHQALELLMNQDLPVPSPSNRVTIYVVGSESELKALYGGNNSFVAGFYQARASGSKAFVQDIQLTGGREISFSMQTLLHEYAHHFRISTSRFSLPRWWQEGEAEFYSSARFQSDGSVSIGRPNNHRFTELAYAREVPIERMFDEELYRKKQSSSYDSFYGQAWLLFHYLYFSESREGQFIKYSKLIMEGTAPLKAAETAFGDLKKLEGELAAYQRRPTFMGWTIQPIAFKTVSATIRPLSEGEAAMMSVVMKSESGVNKEEAASNVIEARKIAAQYPSDPGVLTALSEAEFDAGNDDAAIAAADKALALDVNRKNAYVQKGYALFRKAEKAPDADSAYKAARAPFTALNKLENDHPLPLIYYYRSFTERGQEPSETAKHALERAAVLSPFDQDLWMQVAHMLAYEEKYDLAIDALEPIANTAHEGGASKMAQRMIKQIEKAKAGDKDALDMPIAEDVELEI